MTDAERDLIRTLDDVRAFIEYKVRGLTYKETERVLNATVERLIENRWLYMSECEKKFYKLLSTFVRSNYGENTN